MLEKIYVILVLLFLSCKNEHSDNGFYIKRDYLEYHDSISQKSFELNHEQILLKIVNDTIYNWGDIKYWGEYYVKQPFPFKKIKEKGNFRYFDEVRYNGSVEKFEYIKVNPSQAPLDSLGLDFSRLEKLKAETILVKDYLLGTQKVSFLKNGVVTGLKDFKKYRIYLHSGLNFPYKDLNLIETDNGVWNFRIIKNKLILNKFQNQRDLKTEMFELSNVKIELLILNQ